ncbi:carboxypeptidase-like regulatory domain-containing protein [Pollutimonas thiosulfatoxidans]|uniref:Carboxypeptidase regulatory-like domain-containing protein n=1 Tax=Pollutimonas thiosulfatoxidans TaxID=2028345 RepID=A0A410GEV2_9BURK|nr:carboxypeptidase-like regulatory domain-containing protein [Pollutimonas thiosulfatoxidans]NYT45780.1 carboxypeptidase regulatory-like domain-containing protein [Alcaligenaceae bacterium]QAA94821.1 hypothetical protein CKA81_13900 [Pollutimonas thiosulfatoxidans]
MVKRSSLAAVLATGAILATAAQAQLPPVQTANGVQYVTGGFGQDESNALKQARSDYTLALTFAVAASGSASSPYAGNVQVRLSEADGKVVLDTLSTGPYFLADVKPGAYQLVVTYEGKSQSKDVTIVAGKTTDLKFTWSRPASGPD